MCFFLVFMQTLELILVIRYLKKKSNYLFRKIVHMNNTNMIHYDRIDVSEGIDVNKTNKSKEREVFHY